MASGRDLPATVVAITFIVWQGDEAGAAGNDPRPSRIAYRGL